MEKIVAALWRYPGEDRETLNRRIRETLVPALRECGAGSLRANLQDAAVADGEALRQTLTDPQPDALVQFWLPSANALFRDAVDAALRGAAHRFAAWAVCESTIIANSAYPPVAGERTAGWSQIALLPLPKRLTRNAFVEIWQDRHTRPAIETQSNFEYVQNLVVRALTPDAPAYVAIVEECFPIEALRDPLVFFDAAGDQAKFERNLAEMMASCARFIDPGAIDVFPTSQYHFA